MPAPESQSIDRSKLGVTSREQHADPGATAFMCCDLGFGKQTAFFQEEVAAKPNSGFTEPFDHMHPHPHH